MAAGKNNEDVEQCDAVLNRRRASAGGDLAQELTRSNNDET
jgi:hypothetical protein